MNFSPEPIPIPEGIYNNIVRYITILTSNPSMIYRGSCSSSVGATTIYLYLNELVIDVSTTRGTLVLNIDNITRKYIISTEQVLKLLSLIQDADKAMHKATSIHLKSIVEDVYEKVNQSGLFDYAVEDNSEE